MALCFYLLLGAGFVTVSWLSDKEQEEEEEGDLIEMLDDVCVG